MKTLFLKSRILSILILLVLSISINGCSDDETIKSFLEKQANTDWKFSEPNLGAILYVAINNNQANPFEFWFSILEETCFIHESINDDGNVEILENSANKLIIKVVDDGNPAEHSIITFTVNGDILTVKSQDFEDGVLEDEDLFILQKTSDNLDDLTICPVPV
jgi:hypothetical protein